MVKKTLKYISKAIGCLFFVMAFLQWITFEYPDVNPYAVGAIFAPGMLSQMLNWGFVCILGAIGGLFWSLGRVEKIA